MSLKNVLIGTERYTRFGLIRYLLYLSQLCLTFTAANLAGGGATATYVSLSLPLSLPSFHSDQSKNFMVYFFPVCRSLINAPSGCPNLQMVNTVHIGHT